MWPVRVVDLGPSRQLPGRLGPILVQDVGRRTAAHLSRQLGYWQGRTAARPNFERNCLRLACRLKRRPEPQKPVFVIVPCSDSFCLVTQLYTNYGMAGFV